MGETGTGSDGRSGIALSRLEAITVARLRTSGKLEKISVTSFRERIWPEGRSTGNERGLEGMYVDIRLSGPSIGEEGGENGVMTGDEGEEFLDARRDGNGEGGSAARRGW